MIRWIVCALGVSQQPCLSTDCRQSNIARCSLHRSGTSTIRTACRSIFSVRRLVQRHWVDPFYLDNRRVALDRHSCRYRPKHAGPAATMRCWGSEKFPAKFPADRSARYQRICGEVLWRRRSENSGAENDSPILGEFPVYRALTGNLVRRRASLTCLHRHPVTRQPALRFRRPNCPDFSAPYGAKTRPCASLGLGNPTQ